MEHCTCHITKSTVASRNSKSDRIEFVSDRGETEKAENQIYMKLTEICSKKKGCKFPSLFKSSSVGLTMPLPKIFRNLSYAFQ